MSNSESSADCQQAGDQIVVTDHYINTVQDNGASISGNIGDRATQAAMQKKAPLSESNGRRRSDQEQQDSTETTIKACHECQNSKRPGSTCRCTSWHTTANIENSNSAQFFKPHKQRYRVKTRNLYRIWQPENRVMHLSTVLVVIARGRSWSACKVVQEKMVNQDSNFNHYCARVQGHTPAHPATVIDRHTEKDKCYPVTIHPDESQQFHADCWIDLQRSYDMSDEDNYEFVYCGRMEGDSFTYAKEKHLELYPED